MNPRLVEAALGAALEAIPGAAFVVSARARVRWCNRAARSLLDANPHTIRRTLNAASRSGQDVATVRLEFGEPYYLVVFDRGHTELRRRVELATSTWRLAARQREVLAHIAVGEPNKAIAAAIGCAERTVELHVSALLRKAGADNRAALVARFWQLRT